MLSYNSTINIPYNKNNFIKAKNYYGYYQNKVGEFFFNFKYLGDNLILPRNLKKFSKIFPEYKNKLKNKVVATKVGKEIRLTNLKLRDYQQKVANNILTQWKNDVNDIILQAETGFGKSYIIPYFISELQQKTLIVVDKTLLAHQIYDEISKNSNAEVKILKKYEDLTDVNITTFQFLMKNLDILNDLADNIGFLIVDEVHIAAAQSLIYITNNINAKYRLGLSATPTRSDGLTEVIYDLFGGTKVIANNPNALNVKIHKVFINEFFYYYGGNYKNALSKFIIQQKNYILPIIKGLVNKGRHIVIATDSQDTQEFYKNILEKEGISCGVLNSKASKKERNIILGEFDKENIKVLLGFSVLEKGISIPLLDTIIHLSGATTKEKITQLIGRLKREDKRKKKPIFIDLQFLGALQKLQRIRDKIYEKFKVKEINFDKYISLLKR